MAKLHHHESIKYNAVLKYNMHDQVVYDLMISRQLFAGEVIEGAATVKMLCWEEPFRKVLGRIRQAEAAPMRTMLLIDASSLALMFFCVPVSCVVTFGTAVAMGKVCRCCKHVFSAPIYACYYPIVKLEFLTSPNVVKYRPYEAFFFAPYCRTYRDTI
jgi:hypothetical protein